MELKQRLDPRIIFTGLYVILFLVYLVIGLQPADAVQYLISGNLTVPSIGLSSDIAKVELENGNLNTPNSIIGEYLTDDVRPFLFGHSTSVFQNLDDIKHGDVIYYNNEMYSVSDISVQKKSEIDMLDLLKKDENDSIVLMTCAGELYKDGDASHRLIVTAVAK